MAFNQSQLSFHILDSAKELLALEVIFLHEKLDWLVPLY